MEYKQVQPPEGINSSPEHPLKEFALLATGLLLATALIIAILGFSANLLAPYIPFSAEKKIAKHFMPDTQAETTPGEAELIKYLQALADRLAIAQDLPPDIDITVHYIDDPTTNAFATLGGHVFFFRGLLEKLPHENALAMVMAHEIAHIKHRHPISTLGRGVVIGTALTVVSASAGEQAVANILGEAGLLTALSFSRDQELDSDNTALAAINRVYGHVGGSQALFQVLQAAHSDQLQPPEFYNTHPHSENRIDNISTIATDHGWPRQGQLTDLPANFAQWLEASSQP